MLTLVPAPWTAINNYKITLKKAVLLAAFFLDIVFNYFSYRGAFFILKMDNDNQLEERMFL